MPLVGTPCNAANHEKWDGGLARDDCQISLTRTILVSILYRHRRACRPRHRWASPVALKLGAMDSYRLSRWLRVLRWPKPRWLRESVNGEQVPFSIGYSAISSSWRSAFSNPEVDNNSKACIKPNLNGFAICSPGGHGWQIYRRLEEAVRRRDAGHLVWRRHATSITLFARPSIEIPGPGGGHPS